mmetsp:Transcript_51180/g.119975  ORF Transcript_51180/g.119975 Transcript_51180/m.119975 type:complete len:504 (+) Transcript_51180:175-1686(+)
MSDDGDSILFLCAVLLLLLQSILLAFLFFYLFRRSRKEEAAASAAAIENEPAPSKKWVDRPAGGTAVEAWPDIERAESPESIPNSPPPLPKVNDQVASTKLAPAVRRELADTLRGILEEEISRGLQRSGINDRLDRLEKQVHESGTLATEASSKSLRAAAIGEEAALAGVSQPSPAVSSRSGPATPSRASPLSTTPVVKEETEPPRNPVLVQSEQGSLHSRHELAPSQTQLMQDAMPDRPTARREVDEENSLKSSLSTVQRALGRRDAETQELKKQLRETSQALWNQTLEARHASKRLQDFLSDPTSAPALQADELARTIAKNEELSTSLADARAKEVHWETVARKQRAFFMQSQHVALDSVKRHPAGEVFMVPPPVCLQDDEDFNRLYDIGTQHLNPYATDSWPFEPNAAAQRTNMEQTMPNLDEEDEEDDFPDSDSEAGSPRIGDEASSARGDAAARDPQLRLPIPPGEVPVEPPEPLDGTPPVPSGCPPHHQAAETARSL